MTHVPAHWPPDEAAVDGPSAPLFPLPGVFLFPRLPLPLQIFETRYLQMIEDCLDGPGRIVIAPVVEEHLDEMGGAPDVVEIAGLGEIARHEKRDDGRYLIWLVGLARVRIQEVPSDRKYRKIRYEVLHDVPAMPKDAERLAPVLSEAILARSTQLLNLPDDAPLDLLTDLLLQCLEIPQKVMEKVYGENDATQRAEKALAAHRKFPAPK